MNILKNAGESIILATWPSPETNEHAQQYLEKAGRTCYQSEKGEITDDTSHKFVQRIMKRGHHSVIEHGWRGYVLSLKDRGHAINHIIVRHWAPAYKFLYLSWRSDDEVLVSGNLETWRKLYVDGILPTAICEDLETLAPAVFYKESIPSERKSTDYGALVSVPITSVEQLTTEEECLAHTSATVQFNNTSRGVSHELVRHRPPVYSQESTRYVDESDFNVVVPPHRDESELINLDLGNYLNGKEIMGNMSFDISLKGFFELSEQMYRALRTQLKWKAEDARQSLPIAIKAQIVTSCNLEEWDWIFYKRTEIFAHWEIRGVMTELLSKMQDKYNLFKKYMVMGMEPDGPRFDHAIIKEEE